MVDIRALLRDNIKNLKPYSSARDEYTGEVGIFLDANENSYGSIPEGKLNRYPDPHQRKLKKKLSEIKKISHKNTKQRDAARNDFKNPLDVSQSFCNLNFRQGPADKPGKQMHVAQTFRHFHKPGDKREHSQDHQRNFHGNSRMMRHRCPDRSGECQKHHAKGVESGQKSADQGGGIKPRPAMNRRKGLPYNQVLAVKPGGDKRQRRKRCRADQKRCENQRHFTPQAAHLKHILLAVQRMDQIGRASCRERV